MNAKDIKAHLALLGAASMWGLMSPVGKAAMEAGVSGLSLANMRMIGAACCFWITSLFVKQEKVNHHDLLMLFSLPCWASYAIRDASLSGFRLRRRSTLPL